MIYHQPTGVYPLVICYIAIEHGPVEIVDFPFNSMVIFPSVFWDCLPGGNYVYLPILMPKKPLFFYQKKNNGDLVHHRLHRNLIDVPGAPAEAKRCWKIGGWTMGPMGIFHHNRGFWWRISMVLTCLNHQHKENHWILSYPKTASPLFFWLHLSKSPSPVRCLTGPLTTPSKVTFLGAISLMPGVSLPNNMEVSFGFLMAGVPPSHHRFQYKNVRMTWMIWGTMT